MEDDVKKIFADINGVVTFVCPHCGNVTKEEAVIYKDVRGPIGLECTCGKAFHVQVEFRKFYRKSTHLEGFYSSTTDPSIFEKTIIINLSLQGCGFETIKANLLKLGNEIKIEFQLDDAKRSVIKKKALVRIVQGRYIGCKFKELPGSIDPDLGYYLRKK